MHYWRQQSNQNDLALTVGRDRHLVWFTSHRQYTTDVPLAYYESDLAKEADKVDQIFESLHPCVKCVIT